MVPDAGSDDDIASAGGAATRPSGVSSKGSWRSKDRSAASTASDSRSGPISGSSCRRDEIALMQRVKAAFDPNGILNPGKIFPDG